MAGEVYARLGVVPVINAAGKLTALGGTAQTEAVAAAQANAARSHVDVAELRAVAGQRIAKLTGAEAACVTPGAAAGLAISVASVIAGNDLERVHRLPDAGGAPNRVLLQAAHAIDFGAPIEQMIRMGGGEPRLVDTDLAGALGRDRESLAAFVYVQSHHCPQEGEQEGVIGLEDCLRLCRDAGLPVVIDAAAESDPERYVALGADLVTYSGGKAFAGPTSGFIAGRANLIAACELQHRGIARSMKIGKEQIAGLLAALDEYDAKRGDQAERCEKINRLLLEAFRELASVEASLRPDEAGRPISRVALRAREGAFDVRDLVRQLRDGQPSIRTRNHHLGAGIVLFDPREMSVAQAELVAARVREFFA